MQARWQREIRLLSNLSHPNIVRVYEPLQVEGAPAYAMEIVPGQSLAELIAEQGPQPLAVALDLARQAADALTYLHAQQLCWSAAMKLPWLTASLAPHWRPVLPTRRRSRSAIASPGPTVKRH